eukprot:CAMPEP_0173182360 /NCGR_PEP_ID=MMETSP1141-20130122/7792_1 /TAXON_ID=483371 /ORGANISM="non described non described, Strain CCMP2298" /LENGTH=172 /DNA_ID=CAMNT_0014105441 /DNA_START=517 /DNA_END=1035 /DNA_ORIENTATION=-
MSGGTVCSMWRKCVLRLCAAVTTQSPSSALTPSRSSFLACSSAPSAAPASFQTTVSTLWRPAKAQYEVLTEPQRALFALTTTAQPRSEVTSPICTTTRYFRGSPLERKHLGPAYICSSNPSQLCVDHRPPPGSWTDCCCAASCVALVVSRRVVVTALIVWTAAALPPALPSL